MAVRSPKSPAIAQCANAMKIKVSRFFYIREMQAKEVEFIGDKPIDTARYYFTGQIVSLITISKIEYASLEPRTVDLSFTQSLFACSPVQPTAKFPISSIDVICDASLEVNINDTIFQGENINDHFQVSRRGSEFHNLSDHEFEGDLISETQHYHLKFTGEPNRSLTVKYHIIITLQDGTKFTLNDRILKLRN